MRAQTLIAFWAAVGCFPLCPVASGQPAGQVRLDTVILLRAPGVRRELKISAEQAAKIDEISREQVRIVRDAVRGLSGLKPDERREKLAEVFRRSQSLHASMLKVLSPEQTKRLRGIQIQLGGVKSLLNSDVASELKLDDKQKAGIRKVVQELQSKQRKLAAGLHGLDPEARRKKFKELPAQREALERTSEQQAADILTPAQREKLAKLKGTAVDRLNLFRQQPDPKR